MSIGRVLCALATLSHSVACRDRVREAIRASGPEGRKRIEAHELHRQRAAAPWVPFTSLGPNLHCYQLSSLLSSLSKYLARFGRLFQGAAAPTSPTHVGASGALGGTNNSLQDCHKTKLMICDVRMRCPLSEAVFRPTDFVRPESNLH